MSETKLEMVSEGKVRKLYTDGEYVYLVAGDSVSAFDGRLGVVIPRKGVHLTRLSAFWFQYTELLVPNAFISCDPADMPEELQGSEYTGRVTKMEKLTMIPVEAIVRGYITGSMYQAYRTGARSICGVPIEGEFEDGDQLPEPIFTPTTKAPEGEHDESISFGAMVEVIDIWLDKIRQVDFKCDVTQLDSAEIAEKIRTYSLMLYDLCAGYAFSRGVILADSKFEFGLDARGNVVLGDKLCTQDSSRYWDRAAWENSGRMDPETAEYVPRELVSLDKQVIRDYIRRERERGIAEVAVPQSLLITAREKYQECEKLLIPQTH